MNYTVLSALLNGFLAFLSPCILPMLPVYGVYLLGEGPLNGRGPGALKQILLRMLGFMLGFVPFFMVLGAGAGTLGNLLQPYRNAFPYIGGVLMITFGLMMLDVIPGLHLFSVQADAGKLSSGGFVKMMLLGILLAVSWLSCTSPFLFNVLLMAATQGSTAMRGMWLLLVYSLGLTIPFLLFMALYAKLGGMLSFLRTHQVFIRKAAGAMMIFFGVLRLFRLL
jgi:cytochrome c-type biogenesis protein